MNKKIIGQKFLQHNVLTIDKGSASDMLEEFSLVEKQIIMCDDCCDGDIFQRNSNH